MKLTIFRKNSECKIHDFSANYLKGTDNIFNIFI